MTVIAQTIAATGSGANEYYTPPEEVAPDTRARAIDLNTISRAVNQAFGKLPAPLALRASTANYAFDTGTNANAYVVEIAGLSSLLDGLEVVMRTTRANTNAATLNLNGLGAIPVRRADGAVLQAGDILANSPFTVRYVAALNAFVSSKGDSITRAEAQALLTVGAVPASIAITSFGKGALQPGQVVRLNAAGTALEGADVAAGTDISMVHAIVLSF